MNEDYSNFILGRHPLYERYHDEWRLGINSWWGGKEYKDAKYLRAYQVDLNTPSESITTYDTDADGSVVAKYRAKVENAYTADEATRGSDPLGGSFYNEKLDNTPLYNYVKLIVSEYNSILFRNPPQRTMPESEEIMQFVQDVDGEGNSINEFMSLVDSYTTVYGVCHVGCYKPVGSDIPKWKIHTPLDVTNWEYNYDREGNLVLKKVVIQMEDTDNQAVYRMITPETFETVFVGADDDYIPPFPLEELEQVGDNVYRIVQPNELGYIPIVTAYQNTKIYNNVGSTIIQDVAQIQRSIYGDMAEIYASITYSSHPTLVIDETTDQLNDGQIGSEPGSVVRVPSSLQGEPQYVYEFASPTTNAIDSISKLVDSKIQKLSQIALLRSEELVKSAKSGEQIEVYDDKLAALIRRKATNMENTEFKLWKMWFDWTNTNMPEDFGVSYNRQYNKRALEHELAEINTMMNVMTKYEELFAGTTKFTAETFTTQEQAEQRAIELGGTGSHSHTENGTTVYMPFGSHTEYESTLEQQNPGVDYEEDTGFKEDMRDKIRLRLEQLMKGTSSSNSL